MNNACNIAWWSPLRPALWETAQSVPPVTHHYSVPFETLLKGAVTTSLKPISGVCQLIEADLHSFIDASRRLLSVWKYVLHVCVDIAICNLYVGVAVWIVPNLMLPKCSLYIEYKTVPLYYSCRVSYWPI